MLVTQYNIQTREEAEELAKEWQRCTSKINFSYGELAEWGEFFEGLAIKFDLIEEFTENGII